ncbi:MAG: sulfatase-like hydrolase/transferase [Rikenellaceae bacterium]
MKSKTLLFTTTSLLALSIAHEAKSSTNPNKKSKEQPNVVLIVIDDMGYNDFSSRETALDDVKKFGTPGLNRLASSGVFFTDAYATCPISSPARNGIITGRYQQRWGNYWFNQGGLDPREKTIAHLLKENGYDTKHIGKVHLNGGPTQHPMDRGFDEFIGFINHTWDYKRLSQKDVQAYADKGVQVPNGFGSCQDVGALWRDRDPIGADYDDTEAYTTEIFTDEAIEFMNRERGDNPFFVTLSYNAVHQPTYVMDKEYAEKVGIEYEPWDRNAEKWAFPYWEPTDISQKDFHAKYGRMSEVVPDGRIRYMTQLLALDDAINKLLDNLTESGELENTLIICISDNGGETAGYSNNEPLKGHKYMLGEGGIRVPMMVSYPSKIKPNQISNTLVSGLDILPTILEYTGIENIPTNLDGKSLTSILKGKKEVIHDALVWDITTIGNATEKNQNFAVRKGDWKLVVSPGHGIQGYKLDEKGIATLTHSKYPSGTVLFNLKDDISETTDLAAKYPEKAEELLKIYKQWRSEMEDPTIYRDKAAVYESYCR